MKIVVFSLFIALLALSSVQSEPNDSDYSPENFGDLFRGGLGGLRDLFQAYGENDQDSDNTDDADGESDFKKFCGCRLGTGSRIIGGKEAAKDSIPWHVSLGARSGRHLCGGKSFKRVP